MRVLVTGANGFLGSHLVDRLIEKGDQVHALVRKSSNLRWLFEKPVTYHFGDVTGDLKKLREAVSHVEIVYHVAGTIRALKKNTYYEVNAGGTQNILDACLETNPGIKRIVVVTSLAAHGPNISGRPAKETDLCAPITDYGKSKREAELITLRYWDRLPVSIVRPPAIYGPRDEQVLNFFKMARTGVVLLPGTGARVLNLAHAQDIVSGIVLAGEHPKAAGEIFYIGEDQNYDWRDAASLFARAVGRHNPLKIPIPKSLVYAAASVSECIGFASGRTFSLNLAYARNFVQKDWSLDTSKACEVLGYRSEFPLGRGSRETYQWYRDEGWM